MYCYRCGQRLADGAKHCPNCGASIFYDEKGPLNGASDQDCDSCAQESFGAGYSFHDPNKTSYSGSSDSGSYHSDYQNTDPNSSYSYYGQSSGYSYGQGNNGQNSYNQNGYSQNGYNGQMPNQLPATKQDSYALMGLILAITSAVMCCVPYIGAPVALAGIVFSALGLKSVRRKTMAIIALVVSIICLIANGSMLVLGVYYGAHPELIQDWMNQMESLAGGGEGIITFPVQ